MTSDCKKNPHGITHCKHEGGVCCWCGQGDHGPFAPRQKWDELRPLLPRPWPVVRRDYIR